MTLFAPTFEDPVAETDDAETFGESDVTLSLTKTAVESESVGLTPIATGNVTSRTDDNNSAASSDTEGLEINPNTDLDAVRVTLSANTSGVTKCYLKQTDGTIIDEVAPSGGEADLRGSLTSGTNYYVVADAEGSSYTIGYNDSPSYPYTGTDLDITSGVRNGATVTGTAANITSVESLDLPTSGSVTVEWPTPADVYAWDVGVFQTTPDGETVEVYVEEDQSGGWTEIAGPIQRGDPLPADPANNVRFRVELSRANKSNDPQLNAIYRRRKL